MFNQFNKRRFLDHISTILVTVGIIGSFISWHRNDIHQLHTGLLVVILGILVSLIGVKE